MEEGRMKACERTEDLDLDLVSQIYRTDVPRFMRAFLKRWESKRL